MDKTVIILVSANLLVSIIAIFFKEYFKEKGKNLATKEDINKITEEIENVKNEVSFQSSQKIEWLSNNKKFLSEYFERFLNLNEQISGNIIFHNFFTELSELRNFIQAMENNHSELKKKYYMVYLYENSDSKFIAELLDLTNQISNHFITLKLDLVEVEKLSQAIKLYFDQTKKVFTDAQNKKIKLLEKIEKYLVENKIDRDKNIARCTMLIKVKLMEKYQN